MAKKKKNIYKNYLKWFWVIVMLPLLAFFFVIIITGSEWFGRLPSFEDLENPNSSLSSEVYSDDGIVLGKYYYQNRSNVNFNDLSSNLVRALKATEDIRFEEHSGVDIKGLLRVLFKTVILGQRGSGGGSTISQQLAKNLFPREKISGYRIVIRKMKEWIIAVRLEKRYTKNEIIAMYLNTVEFGSNTYGIKSAAYTFFNKTPAALNTEESAVLVGLLKAPSYYSPVRNPQNSLIRRNIVLFQMNKYDFLTRQEHDSIKKLPIALQYKADDHNAGLATYFREFLRQELTKWCREHKRSDGTPYNLYRDGLKIYTTINSKMQRYAEEAVKENLKDLQKSFNQHWKGKIPWAKHPEVIDLAMKRSERYMGMKASGADEKDIKAAFSKKTRMTVFSWKGNIDTLMSPLDSIKYYKMMMQTGFMSMEPQTGHVRAWVGGNDYQFFKYDHVKEGKRQVGSTFKPFIYTLAVQEGYSPCYKVPNVPVTINANGIPWTPKNSDGKYGGMLSLKEALAESVNCISAFLMKEFGPHSVVEMAHKMGIQSPLEAVPSICLGTADLSVYEMVGAYSTFANKGIYTEPIFLTRIEDKNGVVLQDFIPKKMEAINEETAFVMLNLMKGVMQFGTGVRLRYKYGINTPVAGKTGTTQNQSDGWFMGITPELVSGCWVGNEDRSVHFRTITLGQGANMALPIWASYMKKVYADPALKISQADFERPAGPMTIELDCSKYEGTKTGNDFDFGF